MNQAMRVPLRFPVAEAAARTVALGPVRLLAGDAPALAGFYAALLGLEPRSGAGGVIVLAAPGGDAMIELAQAAAGARPAPQAPGLFHTAFLLPDRASLGGWANHALTRGTDIRGASDHGVSEAFYLADPEGNGIEVYADRPRAAWPLRPDGKVAMVTERMDVRGVLAAGAAAPWSGFPAGARLGHIHLSVSSLARSREFWADLAGFDVRQEDYRGALFLARDGYHHHIALNVWTAAGQPPRAAGTPGLESLVIRLAADELAAIRRRLAGRRAFGEDGDALTLTDPDGIAVRLAPLG